MRLTTLISAAVRAPSGDNTQPWSFALDAQTGCLAMDVEPTRDLSPMNAGQRMARMAIGAALENMLRTAAHNGWELELLQDMRQSRVLLQVANPAGSTGTVDPVIEARVTNRRTYDGRPLAADLLKTLQQATPDTEGVSTVWIAARERLPGLAEWLGRADAQMFGAAIVRRAFLSNVRFDAPPVAEVTEGLSMASLELGRADRVALRLMRRMPNWLLRCGGGLRVFAAHTRRLVSSASGLCGIIADDNRDETDIQVGRAAQRAWLALTAAGLAAQPMMSFPVLENILTHGDPTVQAAISGRDQVRRLGQELRTTLPELEGRRLAFLLRFGYAAPPSGRTDRLPLASVIRPAGLVRSTAWMEPKKESHFQ